MTTKINILAITGAARPQSRTTQLAEISQKYFNQSNVEYLIFDIRKNPLPIYDESPTNLADPNVQLLLNLARAADGLVLVSPEYHGSMSGAIKNVLDWLEYMNDFHSLRGKVVGIMGGGGALGNSGATIQLMMSIRALHGWLMPDVTMNVPHIKHALADGDLRDDNYKSRMQQFADHLVKYTTLFKQNQEVFS